MLTFNDYGLLPEGLHKVRFEEFVKVFGFNSKRREMIEKGLMPFMEELKPEGADEIYLDGSFVTTEENPDDIDGYLVTDTESKLFAFVMENLERWQLEYRIDFYAALTDSKGEGSQKWWINQFSFSDNIPSQKKGYVVMKIPKGGD